MFVHSNKNYYNNYQLKVVLVITSSKLLLLVNLVVFFRELKVVAYFVCHIGSGREKVGVDCKVHVVEEIHRRATWCLSSESANKSKNSSFIAECFYF